MDFVVLKSYVSPFLMLISVFAFIWQTYIIIAFFLFYVNEKGKLTLVFDKYEVAPGYMGMVEFSIPTGEIVDMVTNGYLK